MEYLLENIRLLYNIRKIIREELDKDKKEKEDKELKEQYFRSVAHCIAHGLPPPKLPPK